MYRKSYSFLGFDPIDKKFKVLFIGYPFGPDYKSHRILTLGTGEMSWRKMKCPVRHENVSEGICINGVLYYLAYNPNCIGNKGLSHFVIVSFDVRFEKFKFVEVEGFCKLINYKGKLAVIYWKEYHDKDDFHWEEEDYVEWEDYVKDSSIDELRVWVLEDVEKQEWSKYVYTLRDEDKFSRCYVSIVGGIATTGDIVFTMCDYTSKQPFYVFYFNPERNTFQRVEIKGFGEDYNEAFKNHSVYTFVDHRDLKVNDQELLTSSIGAACAIKVYFDDEGASDSE